MATLRAADILETSPVEPRAVTPPTGGRRVKHAIDRVVAGFALLVMAPILAVIAVALWTTGSRQVLRREERIGERGRSVVLRSFAIGEERLRSRAWQMVIASGAGALPQLWSVVRGELSLIGPRPRDAGSEPPPVRPGLTGLAQLQQFDRWLTLAEQSGLDDEYARTWCHALDARIAWWTIVRTLR